MVEPPVPEEELRQLEHDVQHALNAGDDERLRVLGHGEISLVLGWPAADPAWACKRLPPFADLAAVVAYEQTFDRYLDRLAARGVRVLDSEIRRVAGHTGGVAVYCVQPVLGSGTLATDVLRADRSRAVDVLGGIVEHVLAVTDDRVGIDAQLSNWAVDADGFQYIDVTTPLLRTADARNELDTNVFLASLPWLFRRPVRRFVIPGVIERYHQPRTVLLDLAANLIKERLDEHIPTLLDLANRHVGPPLDEAEVRSDYRSDARTWSALQAVRRVDRAWQRHVRRRPYPFLLPDRIER